MKMINDMKKAMDVFNAMPEFEKNIAKDAFERIEAAHDKVSEAFKLYGEWLQADYETQSFVWTMCHLTLAKLEPGKEEHFEILCRKPE